jgi:hypothetical protein
MFKAFDKIEAVNMIDKIEPHATRLEALANNLERDGIGADLTNGHAVHLRRMAACMRADAAQGRLSSVYHAVGSGISAAAAPKVPPQIELLLKRHGLEPRDYSVAQVDAHFRQCGTSLDDRFSCKSVLSQIGALK